MNSFVYPSPSGHFKLNFRGYDMFPLQNLHQMPCMVPFYILVSVEFSRQFV